MSQLLPPGLSLLEAPHTIVGAIRTTMVFLSWQDNLPTEEIPPRRIWLDGKKVSNWFKDIKKKRDDEMKGKSNTQEGWDGEMVQNEAVKTMFVIDDDD